MFLDYFALSLILTVLVIIFYTFIYIHELPYEAAKHRNHPQQDAIYVGCWLSLLTLHAIWPLIYLWALSHKETPEIALAEHGGRPVGLEARLSQVERRLDGMDRTQPVTFNGPGAS